MWEAGRAGMPFGGFVDIAPHFGGEIPQNPNFWGVNRRFQAKRTLGPVSTWMGDRLRAGIPSRYVTLTRQLGRPSGVA